MLREHYEWITAPLCSPVAALCEVWYIFCLPKDGNDFKEPYQEMDFFTPQLIMIQLEVHEPIIVFNPTFDDCWELIKNSFLEIIKNSDGIPKVWYLPNNSFIFLFHTE